LTILAVETLRNWVGNERRQSCDGAVIATRARLAPADISGEAFVVVRCKGAWDHAHRPVAGTVVARKAVEGSRGVAVVARRARGALEL
jgi:hypothetical protein